MVAHSKKILVTGVAGFLGSHLADLMISQGHTVAGNDNMMVVIQITYHKM